MKLVQEITDLLSSNSPNLNNALYKTKVLMHRMGEKELIGWIDSEVKGYPEDSPLPDYRVVPTTVFGNISNGSYRYSDQPLPLGHLLEKTVESLESTEFRQSIGVIERYAEDDSQLSITIQPEFYPKLSKVLRGGYNVERAWRRVPAGSMLQLTNEVRSRLLDFVLELSEKIPDELPLEEMKEKSKEMDVSGMFKNAVFGPNAIILVGDHNTQKIQNQIVTNDFESLAEILRGSQIQEADIEALREAIANDEGAPEHQEKKYGENVRLWMGSMLQKATDVVWDINVGAAGSLLATALNTFYGWFDA